MGKGDNLEAHADHMWDKQYENCAGGVRVRQILNSNNHAGEIFYPGNSGFESQPNYAERIVNFLFNWTLPADIEVTEPDWWTNRRVDPQFQP